METLQPKLRFPEFDGDWKKKKIDDISELTSSKRVYLTDYVEKGIPFYRGKEITELKQNKQPSDILYITEKSYIEFKSKYGVPQINDLLMTAVGTLGNVYKIKDNNPFYFKDGNLIWFRDIKENSDFLEILLDYKNNDIQKTSIGSTQRALTMVALRKLFFFFPSIEEQTKIANFLSAVDEKLNLLKEKKSLLEDYKKGIMQKIFNQEIRFKDDNGNDFEDWKHKKMDEVVFIKMGQSPDSNSYNNENIGLPLIQGNADINNRLSNPRNWTSAPTKVCEIGDLILTVRAPVGAVAKSNHIACIGRGVCSIQNKDNSIKEFIFQFLLDFETKWSAIEQGSTFTAVSGAEIKNIKIKLPSLQEQTKIANFLSAIDEKIELVSNLIQDTQEYKKGLLQQMFI